jgi:hypothetical protein
MGISQVGRARVLINSSGLAQSNNVQLASHSQWDCPGFRVRVGGFGSSWIGTRAILQGSSCPDPAY